MAGSALKELIGTARFPGGSDFEIDKQEQEVPEFGSPRYTMPRKAAMADHTVVALSANSAR